MFPWTHTGMLSRHYLENVAQLRPPVAVMLPTRQGGAVAFCIDSHPSSEPDAAWDVQCPWPIKAGTKPAVTVSPSIDCVGLWHGFLVDGVLSDDVG